MTAFSVALELGAIVLDLDKKQAEDERWLIVQPASESQLPTGFDLHLGEPPSMLAHDPQSEEPPKTNQEHEQYETTHGDHTCDGRCEEQ